MNDTEFLDWVELRAHIALDVEEMMRFHKLVFGYESINNNTHWMLTNTKAGVEHARQRITDAIARKLADDPLP